MSLFITGTGTGVGKTIVTAGLAALLNSRKQSFCVYKPIQTGCPDPSHPEDLETVKTLVGAEVATFCSYCFADPVAPYAADPGHTIQPHKLLLDYKRLQAEHKIVLVEGAGGVRVPVARHFEMLDLIRMLQIPVLVVASPFLGTINHTLLTLDALERQRVEVKGVVISGVPDDSGQDPAVQSLEKVFDAFLPVPLLGILPVLDPSPGAFAKSGVVKLFETLGLFED